MPTVANDQTGAIQGKSRGSLGTSFLNFRPLTLFCGLHPGGTVRVQMLQRARNSQRFLNLRETVRRLTRGLLKAGKYTAPVRRNAAVQ